MLTESQLIALLEEQAERGNVRAIAMLLDRLAAQPAPKAASVIDELAARKHAKRAA